MTDLGTLGGDSSQAQGINNAGQVVGIAGTAKDIPPHGFLYSNGKMTDLGPLGSSAGGPQSINASGLAVGWDAAAPSLYKDGKRIDLNTLIPSNAGWTLLSASAINNSGQIAGSGYAPGGLHAYLLTPTAEAPEPGSLTLLALGALGLAAHRWRRRRQATGPTSAATLRPCAPCRAAAPAPGRAP
jgi:probable HAF family extracellular repeat protein